MQYRHKETNVSCANYGEYSDWKFVSGGELEGIKEFIKQGYSYEIRELIVKTPVPTLAEQQAMFEADYKDSYDDVLSDELDKVHGNYIYLSSTFKLWQKAKGYK